MSKSDSKKQSGDRQSGDRGKSTFRTQADGGLYYGSKYLCHPGLMPGMFDVKAELVKLVRSGITDEEQVHRVARVICSAYEAGCSSGRFEADWR